MKHIHFNNHISSKQSFEAFAVQLLTEIMNNKDGILTMSMDDGDGDLCKYEIHVYSERVENVSSPLNEN